MSSLIKIPDEYHLCITMTWFPGKPHRISGHIYEIIDYYMILSTHFNVCILFGDTVACWEDLESIITSKYNVSRHLLEQMKKDVIISKYPRFIRGRNILVVDGGLIRLEKLGVKLMFDNIFVFKCSYLETLYNSGYSNIVLLQDDRLYISYNPRDVDISINYKKKVLVSMLKSIQNTTTGIGLLYCTKNCRYVSQSYIDTVVYRFKEIDRFICITETPEDFFHEKVMFMAPPVLDLFEMFDTYIYTPLAGKFDGSPRFPVECAFYNKKFTTIDIDDDYLSRDTGLKFRLNDIHEDVESLYLTDQDEIITIVDERI